LETSVAQFDRQAHWVTTENIARFQEQLKSETDTCQRKLLEGLLVLERERLKLMSPPPGLSFGPVAAKVPEHDKAEKEQGDGSPQEH
jgi:hypothetical protein